MGYFPFYIDIKDKKCLIIGGGRVALRKLGKLLPFEPDITVVAPRICDEISGMKVKTIKRGFCEEDLDGAFMVISATNNHELNSRIYGLCTEKNILINSVDDKQSCGFIFPALIKNGDVTIGITTSGAAPAYARKLREDIEKIIDDKTPREVRAVSEYREKVKREIPDEAGRKEAIEKFMENNI